MSTEVSAQRSTFNTEDAFKPCTRCTSRGHVSEILHAMSHALTEIGRVRSFVDKDIATALAGKDIRGGSVYRMIKFTS